MFSSFFGGNKDQDSAAAESLMNEGDNATNPLTAVLQPYLDDKHEYSDVRDPNGTHYSHLTKNDDGSIGAPFSSCYFTLANTIMGAGMLGLPYAFSRTGWVLGSLLIMLSATSSSFALHLLSCCALKLPYPSSFYKVANAAFPSLEKLIDIAVVVKCFGVATSYLIVIGGLMPDVIEELYGSTSNASRRFWESRLVWVTLGFAIVAPLASLKQLSALKYTSFLSICFVFFLTVLVVLYSAHIDGLDPCATDDDGDDGVCVGEKSNFTLNLDTMKVLSIFVFGFTCHQNMFTIVNEIHVVTKPHLNKVIFASVGTAFTLYMIVATSGYNTFGDNVESNILQSYPSKAFARFSPLISSASFDDPRLTLFALDCQILR